MAIQLFQPQYRSIQSPVDLDTLAKTYNTLEQGHQQAVTNSALYATKLAELDLNEAEDEWRQQQINQIRQTLNDNMVYGNAAAAVDDLTRTYGDITSNAGMIGRLRAQQDYKTYLANLDANQTLDEDTKEYYREKNQYYYEDKFDNNGNIIGGTKWKPIKKEVNHVPLNLIFDQALRWAAKEGGQSNAIKFLDANGNPTDDYSQSATGEMFTNTTGKWEKLSADKVRQAIDAAFNSITGARESFEQQYTVAKWKADKGGTSDIYDRNGIIMTKDQYLNSKIDPFVDTVKYHNYYSTTQYGDAWKSQLALQTAKAQAAGYGQISSQHLNSLSTVTGEVITVKNNAPVEAQAAITTNRQELSDILNKQLGLNIDLHTATSEERSKAIASIQDPQLRAQAVSYNLKLQNNLDYINSISEGHPDKDAFDTYNAIMSMSDLPDNEYANRYKNLINGLFDGADSIRQYFDDEEFERFKKYLGEDAIKSSGIVLGSDKNGHKYVELNADNYNSVYTYANAIKQSEDGFWGHLFSLPRTNKVVRVHNNEEHLVNNLMTIQGTPNASKIDYFRDIVSMVNNLNKASDRVLNGGMINKSNIGFGTPTPYIADLDLKIQNGVDITENKTKREQAYKQFVSNVAGISLTQSNGYMLDPETNTYKQMTSEQALENTKILSSDALKDLEFLIVPDPVTGDACIQVTVPGKLGDDYESYKREPRKFIIGSTAIKDEAIKSWNNNTSWIAMNKVNKFADSNRPLSVTSDAVFSNVPHIKFLPNGMSTVNISVNDTVIGSVDRGSASKYLDPIIQVQQVAEYSKYNNYPAEMILPFAQKAAEAIASMSGGDTYAATYYQNIIMQNLGY